jgi:uncharacterized membrane protein YeiB
MSTPGARVVGLDVARSLAIVGMIAVNVGPRGEPGLLGWVYDLPLGRASLLFMLLAGVGMSIMTRSSRAPGGGPLPWRTVLWRAALLLVGGLALQLLGHEASVILPLYGVLFVACLPLLKAPGWTLIATAVTSLVLGPLLWLWFWAARGGAFVADEPTLLDPPVEILTGILFTGAYPAVVWAAPFLLGMLLGRADLRSPTLHRRLVLWGAAAAIGAYVLSQALIALFGGPGREPGLIHLVAATAHSQMPLWLLSSTGVAAVVLGLCLLGERFAARCLGALAATGRLSLTVYVGHLLVLALLVRPGPFTLAGGILTTSAICAFFILFSWLWARRFRTGPLESLLRLPGRRGDPATGRGVASGNAAPDRAGGT